MSVATCEDIYIEHWEKKKITMGVDVFSINFLKEIAGAKPELDVVHRGPDCQGLSHRGFI